MKERELNDVMEFLKEKEKRFVHDFNIDAMIRHDYPLEIIELIIKMGSDINGIKYNYLFQDAITRSFDRIEVLELLKKYGIKFDNVGASEALYDAINMKYFEEAIFLIDNGTDVHWMNDAILELAIRKANTDADYYKILKSLCNAKTY